MARVINGTALREVRDLVGIDQRELARRCGIRQGTVSNIERGKHGVSPELMRKFADVLGVSLDTITIPVPETVPEVAAS
jgi:transcriptional regulator with XRE-family HTH domain